MSSFARNRVAVRGFNKAFGFADAIQKLPGKMMPPPMRLIQIGSLYWQSRALYVAAKLDIATLLGDKTLPVGELAQQAGCHADSLYRLLRMLVSMDIFSEPESGQIANNNSSNHLDEANPQCVRAMILMHNSPEMTRPWTEELENGIRSGEVPFARVHGENLFDYMDHHAEFESLFARAMDTTEALLGNAFITDFDWGRYERIIDVGGSKGSKAIAILKKFPKLRAVVFDREQVIEEARDYWQGKVEEDVLSRIEFVSGDARDGVPEGGERDAYLLCAVFHGLGDADSIRILRNIREVSQGDVAIFDAVMAELGESPMITSFDMQMLMGTEGRERTATEWQALFNAAGYRLVECFDTRSLWKLQLLRQE